MLRGCRGTLFFLFYVLTFGAIFDTLFKEFAAIVKRYNKSLVMISSGFDFPQRLQRQALLLRVPAFNYAKKIYLFNFNQLLKSLYQITNNHIFNFIFSHNQGFFEKISSSIFYTLIRNQCMRFFCFNQSVKPFVMGLTLFFLTFQNE